MGRKKSGCVYSAPEQDRCVCFSVSAYVSKQVNITSVTESHGAIIRKKEDEEMWGRCCTIASAQGSSRLFTPKLWMHADEAFSNWLEVGKKSPQGGLLRHTESWVVSTSCQETSLAPSRHLTRSLLLSAPISSASSLNPSFFFSPH